MFEESAILNKCWTMNIDCSKIFIQINLISRIIPSTLMSLLFMHYLQPDFKAEFHSARSKTKAFRRAVAQPPLSLESNMLASRFPRGGAEGPRSLLMPRAGATLHQRSNHTVARPLIMRFVATVCCIPL